MYLLCSVDHGTYTNNQQRPSSRPTFRSRRSYPSLNQISLTPLTPRYPIDDDDDDGNQEGESQGYYSARSESPDRPHSAHGHTPTRSSYLSSFSVPGSPGVLSQSRSGSRTRHGRSKSSSRSQDAKDGRRTPTQRSRHQTSNSTGGGGSSSGRSDPEWMLRTGIALASSTREEKGQSWLVKRESSTSLASEANYETTHAHAPSAPRNTSHKSRSGLSTPSGATSRRGSRSHALSRRSSRPDLAMSGLEMIPHTQTPAGEVRDFTPDVVDERIRAEMDLMQQGLDEYASETDEESFDSADEIDEKELQRLTRERGFGLGSWLDRMVEWTLFGVDEWPSSSDGGADHHPAPVPNQTATSNPGEESDHGSSVEDDNDTSISDKEDEPVATAVKEPGETGGWEDARWLLYVIKRALI